MALKARAPGVGENKRLKFLAYGVAGVGKSYCALQFPKPYYIDTERGVENEQYQELLKKAGGAYFFTNDSDELIAEVRSLMSTQHDYRTLVIDSITEIYDDLLDASYTKIGTTDFNKHRTEPDIKIKHLLRLCVRLDMNVVLISHSKAKWKNSTGSNGKMVLSSDGETWDCLKGLDYKLDLVVEVSKRGHDRVASVVKTRESGFQDGEIFSWDYSTFAEKYGSDNFERDSVSVALASDKQVAMIESLFKECGVSDSAIVKFLNKHNADNLSEIPREIADKAIEHYQGVKKGAA